MSSNDQWGLRVGSLTDVGRHRKRNEDSLYSFVPDGDGPGSWSGGAFAVADGMGGHEAGDVASQFIVSALEAAFSEGGVLEHPPAAPLLVTLESLLLGINEELHKLAEERGAVRGMGSTLTLAVFFRSRVYLAHVGDSRLYRMRNGALQQLSEDHSWAAEQRRKGLITAEEEENHPQKNLLTECIGVDGQINVQTRVEPVTPGDRYFLCSDGLHGQVSKVDLAAVLSRGTDPQEALQHLIDSANDAGGPDNITGVIIDIGDDLEVSEMWPTRAGADATAEITQPVRRAQAGAKAGSGAGRSRSDGESGRAGGSSRSSGTSGAPETPEELSAETTSVFARPPQIGWVADEDYDTEEPATVPSMSRRSGRGRRIALWVVAVLVVLVAGGYWFFGRTPDSTLRTLWHSLGWAPGQAGGSNAGTDVDSPDGAPSSGAAGTGAADSAGAPADSTIPAVGIDAP